jgi:hypothetical protein
LQYASETGELGESIQYAVEGFRDGLENTIEIIHKNQTELTWNNYVHDIIEKMQGKNQQTMRRMRQLAYYIPADRFYSIDEIMILNTNIAGAYRQLNKITLRRDLDLLTEKELLITEKSTSRTGTYKYRANYDLLHGLLPEASVPLKRHY